MSHENIQTTTETRDQDHKHVSDLVTKIIDECSMGKTVIEEESCVPTASWRTTFDSVGLDWPSGLMLSLTSYQDNLTKMINSTKKAK